MPNLYIALLHYPVYNREHRVVVTSVTNMDIHDISRTARTFGVRRFYIVTPLSRQQEFVGSILDHWRCGPGAAYNPSRKEAFEIVSLEENLEGVIDDIRKKDGDSVKVVATGAGLQGALIRFGELKEKLEEGKSPYLIVFGTGWGIADEAVGMADFLLEPIKGPASYNHLPVRAAVAITLDRLVGMEQRQGN